MSLTILGASGCAVKCYDFNHVYLIETNQLTITEEAYRPFYRVVSLKKIPVTYQLLKDQYYIDIKLVNQNTPYLRAFPYNAKGEEIVITGKEVRRYKIGGYNLKLDRELKFNGVFEFSVIDEGRILGTERLEFENRVSGNRCWLDAL